MWLTQLIAWAISGGGAGVIAYKIMAQFKCCATWQAERRRWAAFAIAGAIGAGLHALSIWLQFSPLPATAQGWFIDLSGAAFTAAGAAQLVHGRMVLSKAPMTPPEKCDLTPDDDAYWSR
jgi:hypothetical protein